MFLSQQYLDDLKNYYGLDAPPTESDLWSAVYRHLGYRFSADFEVRAHLIVALQQAQHFRVGQPVEACPTCKYDEWRGVPLWIAGISAELKTGKLLYTVSESWPPAKNGDLSDQWEDCDLCARLIEGGVW